MKTEATIKIVQHGSLMAKVPVVLIHDESGWSPYISHADILKLDDVREALCKGEISEAARYGEVFELTKVA